VVSATEAPNCNGNSIFARIHPCLSVGSARGFISGLPAGRSVFQLTSPLVGLSHSPYDYERVLQSKSSITHGKGDTSNVVTMGTFLLSVDSVPITSCARPVTVLSSHVRALSGVSKGLLGAFRCLLPRRRDRTIRRQFRTEPNAGFGRERSRSVPVAKSACPSTRYFVRRAVSPTWMRRFILRLIGRRTFFCNVGFGFRPGERSIPLL
jgi:hypothetical protein